MGLGALGGVLWSVSSSVEGPVGMELSGWVTNRSFAPSATCPPPMLVLTRGVAVPHSKAGWDSGYFSPPCPCTDPVERIKRVSMQGQNLHGTSARLPALSETKRQGEAQRHGTRAQAMLGGAGCRYCALLTAVEEDAGSLVRTWS